MGISGYEAFLLVTVTPIVLGIRSLRRVMATYRGFFYLLSLIGVASCYAHDPALRLTLTAVGLAISVTTWCASWIEARAQSGTLERSILIWGIGLIMHSVVKMAWWTENPIWPIMNKANGGWNDIGIVLAVIASIEVLLRDYSTKPSSQQSPSLTEQDNGNAKGSWLMSASGFAAVLFALHSLYTDSSTIMRWTVDGYPNYGPEPVPWGVATIAALALGLAVSSVRGLATNFLWYAVGCVACFVFYNFAAWNGYYGGLVLGFYFMSIMPSTIKAITVHPPFKTLLTAFMIYNLLCLAHVWVVAYEFVPGGVYARERTNWILFTLMLLTGCGVYNMRSQESQIKKKMVQLHVLKAARSMTRVFLGLMVTASILIAANRTISAVAPAPYHPAEKSFTAGIWTIHFALDDDMYASEVRMRDIIRDLEMDVVGKCVTSEHTNKTVAMKNNE